MRAKYVVGKCNDKNQPPFCNVCSRGKHYQLITGCSIFYDIYQPLIIDDTLKKSDAFSYWPRINLFTN